MVLHYNPFNWYFQRIALTPVCEKSRESSFQRKKIHFCFYCNVHLSSNLFLIAEPLWSDLERPLTVKRRDTFSTSLDILVLHRLVFPIMPDRALSSEVRLQK